jgi:hypothetical protein
VGAPPPPAPPRDRFIAEINPTPTLYNVQNVYTNTVYLAS